MAISFGGQIPHFLEQYLSKPASALPKGCLWVVDFEGLDQVKTAILKTAELERNEWKITEALNLLVNKSSSKNDGYKGCLFCQAVSIPGEAAVANPEGIQKNHYLMTTTGDGRTPYSPTGLKMSFLDTNVSFADNILRPWVITTSRLGMVARSGDNNYRQNITIYKLGVLTKKTSPFITQKYTFVGACPIDVSPEEYNYLPISGPVVREATFVFHSYKLTVPNSKVITQNNAFSKETN